jgi:hypothetical protein
MLPAVLIFFSFFGVISIWCSVMDILHDVRARVTIIQADVNYLTNRLIHANEISGDVNGP